MGNYNWKKTVMKFIWSAGFVLVSGLLATMTDNAYWVALIPVLEALRNILKHKFEMAWL